MANTFPPDPNGTTIAFNSTLAHFDLYREFGGPNDAALFPNPPNGTLTWSSKFNSTQDGVPIPGTAFNFTIPKSPLGATAQNVSWTLNIPSGGVLQSSGFTYVKFDWNGTVGTGTGARYLVFNGTGPGAPLVRRIVASGNFTGSPTNSTGIPTGAPVACGPTDECFDVTKFIGYNLTLTFLFNSTTAGNGLKVQVSNVEVASVRIIQDPAFAHWMYQNPSNPVEIVHNAKMRLSYNSTVTYIPRPRISNQTKTHPWGQMILTLYWPASFTLNSVQLLGVTGVFPTVSPAIPLSQGTCVPIIPTLECTNVKFVSLNMTSPGDAVSNKTAFFTATSINAISSLGTGLGGVDTSFWAPGENMTLRVVNRPGVDLPGTQVAWFTDPNGITSVNNSTLSINAKSGTANYTVRLPSSPLGNWSLTTTFVNGYDYGNQNGRFRVEELQVKPGSFSLSGSAGSGAQLTVKGALTYKPEGSSLDSPVAGNVNTTVFALSTGPGAGLSFTRGTPSSGLYISNISAVNGVGSIDHPIIMYFSLNSTPSSQYQAANLTIDHEWYSGLAHGVNVTISMAQLGDEPYNKTPLTYSIQALITSTGVQLTIQSLQTNNKVTVNLTPGVGGSAVPFLRQHFGLFRLTIQAKNTSSHLVSTQSLESPSYAYILYSPLVPSQLLAYSPTVPTLASDGSFSTSLPSGQILGAKNLVFLVLARDSNGIVLGDSSQNPAVISDSTTLTPTADIPSEATVQQSVTVTLHLKSNSTLLKMTLTLNLDVTGQSESVPTQTQSVSISPGASRDVSFTFRAPSSSGRYLVTFSSPQYGTSGSPLLTKTLQVSLISTNLQLLLPAAIGLVAAIVILGAYVIRKSPGKEVEPSEKTKPAPKPSKPQPGQTASKYLTLA